MLHTLKNVEWYVQTRVKEAGQSFSEEALTWDPDAPFQRYEEKIKCLSPKTSMIVLNFSVFRAIVTKFIQQEQKQRCYYIQRLPYFQSFSMPQARRLIANSKEVQYNRAQQVFR